MSNSPMLNGFDRVYIINLKTRPDRWREIQAQLQKAGIDPTSEKVQRFDAIRPVDAGGFPTIGTRGCFMSHLGVLEDALKHGHQRILVLEDDLDFDKDFQALWPSVQAQLTRQDWHIFHGVYELPDSPNTQGVHPVSDVTATTAIVTLPMLGYQGKAIPTAVNYLRAMLRRPPGSPEGGPMHVDGALNWLRQTHRELQTIVATPQLGHQRASRTDIHDLKWFDCLPLLSQLAQSARRLKRFMSN